MWKAIITNISNVNDQGIVDVLFDVIKENKVLYQSMKTSGTPDEIKKNIKSIGTDLKKKNEEISLAKVIEVGKEIDL